MMEDKVAVGQFETAARDEEFQRLIERFKKANPWSVKGEWELGGLASGKAVRIENKRLPVLRVTVTEAYCFARWLGGNLPTVQQWDKAGGRFNGQDGPFRKGWQAGQIAVDRKVEGPVAVGTAPADISFFGCRDMAGNGKEWTRTLNLENETTVPASEPQPDLLVVQRGHSYGQPGPFLFKEVKGRGETGRYDRADPQTGFRVVLEPGVMR
jgi:formylglycine-generating enzyme required for sulfatase activity